MAGIDTIDTGKMPLFKPEQLPQPKTLSEKGLKAQKSILKAAALAGGVGLIPLPRISGQIAVGGLLLKLLRDLCAIYDVSFSDQQMKILITAVLGGAHYGWISRYLLKASRNFSSIPHSPAALILRPAVSGLTVYYLGRLFLIHLESGVWLSSDKTAAQ